MDYANIKTIKFPHGETGQWEIDADIAGDGWDGRWWGPGRIILVDELGQEQNVTLGDGDSATVVVHGGIVSINPA